MTSRRALAGGLLVILLFACKTERKSKNDDIAACNASGGHWEEGGCNDNGRCEKSVGTGMSPDDDDDMEDDDVAD